MLPPSTTEKSLARNVLAELNPKWESKFSHTFTEALTTVVPEYAKKGKNTKKKRTKITKAKDCEINDHFSKNATMSVLAEAESMASYSRKRLALSYERPTTPKRRKSHSPKEANIIDGAMEELENFPPNQKINWSSMARMYEIPQKNAGQVLKETAVKHGIHTSTLEQSNNALCTPRIHRHKCRLEISMPCLPTVGIIKEERRQLVLSGELNIGEPCAPFHITKSVITSEGNVEFKDV